MWINPNDLSPVMIELLLERLVDRGEIILPENPTCNDKLRIMLKVEEEVNRINKEHETEI